CQQYDGDSLTF
nr:immunoglobulin light chain junction region [Macaca mulatta]